VFGKLFCELYGVCLALDLLKERFASDEGKPVLEVWILDYSYHDFYFNFFNLTIPIQ
jgi:hypothetical protein